jgi:hypothetical protein
VLATEPTVVFADVKACIIGEATSAAESFSRGKSLFQGLPTNLLGKAAKVESQRCPSLNEQS